MLLHQTIADRLGLNVIDHKALNFVLEARKPITPGQLAALTGLTTGAITGIVDRLEAAGFVRRKRDPDDRRQVMVEINLGKVRSKIFPIFEQLEKQMIAVAASYRQEDLETIMDFLERGIAISREQRSAIREQSSAS